MPLQFKPLMALNPITGRMMGYWQEVTLATDYFATFVKVNVQQQLPSSFFGPVQPASVYGTALNLFVL